jgi:hypothetical protein
MKRSRGYGNRSSNRGKQGLANRDAPGYDIGYGKPPKDHQFQPGQSGNPRGRPKGAKNMATIIREELNTRVSIRTGDTVRTVSKIHASIIVATNRALKGDVRAFQTIIKLVEKYGEFAPEAGPAHPTTIQIQFVKPDGSVVPLEETPESLR